MFGKTARCNVSPVSFALLACVGCHAPEPAAPSPGPAAAAPASSVVIAPPVSTDAPVAQATPASHSTEFPKTPPQLQVPPNSSLVLKARARGFQIYECEIVDKVEDGPQGPAFAWTLKAPDADLFDDQGRKVAHHFAGPTWQATDGSTAVGKVMGKADAPDPRAIPWLMLTTVGKGPGLFASVMHVQRLDTSGGKAPDSGCDALHATGKAKPEARVPYEATYYFYSLTPGSK